MEFPKEDQESIQNQLQKLSLNLENMTKQPIESNLQDTEQDSINFKITPRWNSGFFSECDSKFLPMDDNLLAEEVERLACALDAQQMVLEDYRAHDLRLSGASILIPCDFQSLQSFSKDLSQALKSSRPCYELALGQSLIKFSTSQLQIFREAPLEYTKKKLDQYSHSIKQMKLNVFREKEETEKLREQVEKAKRQLESAKENLEVKLEHIRSAIQHFLGLLQALENQEEHEEESEDLLKERILSLENVLVTATGKLKETSQMQLNRLKTKLATLRSEAVLNNCLQITNNFKGKHLNSGRMIKAPRTSKGLVRSTTPVKQTKYSPRFSPEPSIVNDPFPKEVSLIKARLEQKQEELSKREQNPSGSYLEKKLIKEQNDLDRQKLIVADKTRRFNIQIEEFAKKQDVFYAELYKLREVLVDLLENA